MVNAACVGVHSKTHCRNDVFQERLQKATEHAQHQHESVSAGLRDPVSGSITPANDLMGLKAVAGQLAAELQAVLASGLREDSEGVITARKLLTSVQEQIETRTAEVAIEHELAVRTKCDGGGVDMQ